MDQRRLLILSCSATKRPGEPFTMTGIQRYDGPLWRTLRAADPTGKLAKVAHLSARYGFGDASFGWIDDYNARLDKSRAAELIDHGITRAWGRPHRPGTATINTSAEQEIASMTLTTGLDRVPFEDICLCGGELYLDVMRRFLGAFIRSGYVARQAKVTEINGAIGHMRHDLRTWLATDAPPPLTNLDAIMPSAAVQAAAARGPVLRASRPQLDPGGLFAARDTTLDLFTGS